MAYSSFNTKLSINRWGELMGIDAFTLNGVRVGTCADVRTQPNCEKVWTQYRWQSSTNATREQLGEAIQSATQDIEWKLGYPVAPTFIENETIVLRSDEGRAIANTKTILLYLENKKVISAGRETPLRIELSGMTDYSVARTNDSMKLSFFLGVQGSVDEAFLKAEHWDVYLDAQSTAALTDSVYKMPKPKLVMVTTVPNFPSDALVYIEFVYMLEDLMDFNSITAFPGKDGYIPPDICVDKLWTSFFLRERTAFSSELDKPAVRIYCRGGSDCTTNCTETIYPGIVEVIDAEAGLIALTLGKELWEIIGEIDLPGPIVGAPDQDIFIGYVCATDAITCLPYKVEIDYQAGAVVKSGEVFMEAEIAKMAAARLPMEVCECGNYGVANNYRDDYAIYDKSSPRRATTKLLDNPFGTRRGEVEAWMSIQKYINEVQYAGLI